MSNTSSEVKTLGGHGAPEALTGDLVTAVRYRAGVIGEADRTVHLVTSPLRTEILRTETKMISALCGTQLIPHEVELVEPGWGMPCTWCLLHRSSTVQPDPVQPDPVQPDPAPGPEHCPPPADYRALGWPVATGHNQMLLTLGDEATALLIPADLAESVRAILTDRRSPPPLLVHPYAPNHQVLLAGERYGIPLPWPPGVHEIVGTLPLPPSMTPRGPIRWRQLPERHALSGCREIDVLSALRTALRAAHDAPRPSERAGAN